MKRRVIVRPQAEADIASAIRWYDKQRVGLGDDFLRELEFTFARLSEKMSHRVSYKRYSVIQADRFPYKLFYTVGRDEIRIARVIHEKRAHEKLL